jgi:hypothetical protein
MGRIRRCRLVVIAAIPLAGALLAANSDPFWKTVPATRWTEDQAKQLLEDSPWAGKCILQRLPNTSPSARRDSGDWDAGVGHGVGLAGTGIFGAARQRAALAAAHAQSDPGSVAVRWESALPVQAAETKLGLRAAPSENEFYSIEVIDIPVSSHWNKRALRGLAYLKRADKKDFRPSRVQVLRDADGRATIVYLFRRTEEITKRDQSVEFVAQIDRLFVAQYFFPEQMRIGDLPEL